MIVVVVINNQLLVISELEGASELVLYNWRSYRDRSTDIGQPEEYYELLTTTLSGQSKVSSDCLPCG